VSASFPNLILTHKNTKLGDDELEMLVVLKTNRDFMEEMRKDARFCKLAREKFGMTVLTKDKLDDVGDGPATEEGTVTVAREDEVESVPVEHDAEDYADDYADPECHDLMENEWEY